ncbi:MAG: glycosyltransferase [Symplocastrum torsivum CPER-KK1]|jgi:GT2 family glycosyltransferase/flagellar biosynthesis chaperone FliJ|uniref:Glycosyltransferase n=1 Tax=Symplocastrum torsivum CPER-KK1 TaxID=450513 RepID=A0A951PHB6_9CYAN|nr:glycosyltransferase [Symplocastrum torsivum CPER-KK1]
MQNNDSKQSIFIITGMHRSGTSLTASLLQSAGVDIGKRLMPAGAGNVKGYFENLNFTEFHENILLSQGISKAGWTVEKQIKVPEQFLGRAKLLVQENSSRKIWGWKDPRTTLFLNYWADLIPQANFLLIYRAPWEVIDSLYRRRNVGDEGFDFNPNFALEIWLNYNQEVLRFYEQFSERCLLISIYSIAHDPSFLIQAIKDKFGIPLNYPDSDIYDDSLLNTQSYNLHRPALIKHYFPQVWELYQELNAKAVTPEALSSSLVPELPPLPPYEAWVLQDWLDLRRLEKESFKLQTQLEQSHEELDRNRSQLQQTLQQNQAEQERSHVELAQSQSQLQQTQSQLQQTQSQLQQTQSQLQQTQSQLQQTQSQLQQTQSQLQQVLVELEQSKTLILAMESSKFWKMRIAWFWLKQVFGVTENSKQSFNRLLSRAKKLLYLLKNKGLKYTITRLSRKVYLKLDDGSANIEVLPETYQGWLQKNFPRESDLRKMAETVEVFTNKPVISIIMPVFNTAERFLREAIESVLTQVYPYWELCIADDASTQPHVRAVLEEYRAKDSRIKVAFREQNGHIAQASNSAIELATGEFLSLLDHDDLLTPDALYEVALLLNRHPEADMIYSDEDKVDEHNQFCLPFFKPDWCPDSFLSRMYTCHLGTYRRSLVTEIGGFRVGYEGSQDYDLVLRVTEKTEKIFHIPKILYHWRVHPESASSGAEAKPYAYIAAEKALTDALSRRGEKGVISGTPGYMGLYVTRYKIENHKLVSIIIPTKDLGETLNKCLKSIFEKSVYPKYEVIVIDNGSTEDHTTKVINFWETHEPSRFRCYKLDIPFNFSKINNYAVTQAKGEYILLLNNDIEVVTPDWIDAMVEQAQRPSIGAVGGLLLYPDNSIQHAGIVLGIGGVASHSHKKLPSIYPGYGGQVITINNYSAITGACLMCRREVYERVGGFEEKLAVAYNDVDFCLKLVEKGYRNIYLPHVVLYHHESKSRGHEDTPEKLARLAKEAEYMQTKWSKILKDDPCYNPNLTRSSDDYRINI